ncbi:MULTISPECIES: FecR family protein [Sphingomonas]|jgi:transmembrane sensor|uniref:FecR family protein n=1 Tax=Sphingomonas TaxID=13687 RepID=UPI0014573707|nr:FecR domain-containing protein [Sphingomonas sp. S2M10]NLS26381.1 hypothetical protein [Sphingomonas sp. S2M10]
MDDKHVPSEAPRQDQLLEEGSFWFARMRGPDAEMHRAQFDAWLARGAAHLGAYNRAGEIFALGKFLAESPNAEASEARASAYGGSSWWKGFVWLALVVVTVGTGAWIKRDALIDAFGYAPEIAAEQAPTLRPGIALATRVGERRSFTLADGSKVTLDPDSQLLAALGTERRELSLKRGRARFDVAHESRPFVVFAGGGSVTARGTIFDVIVGKSDAVTVRLLRGAVDVVRPATSRDAKPAVARLAPGEEFSFGETGVPDLGASTKTSGATAPEPAPAALAAREYSMAPLSAVIAETNKGSGLLIRAADPAIGALKVSGRFRIDDPERVAERLATLFDLEIDRSHSDEIVLRSQ